MQKLRIAAKDLMMMCQGQDPEPLLRSFKTFLVKKAPCDIFFEDEPVLDYIGDVKCMWEESFKLDLILPHFETIVVRGLESFISLMPYSTSFQNLTILEVDNCNNLEHLGAFSMAKNLVKLRSLEICLCEKIV